MNDPQAIPRFLTGGSWSPFQEDVFFDAVANGSTIASAARTVGKSKNAGAGKFHRARLRFGEQGR